MAFGWAWGGDCVFVFYLPFSSCTFAPSCLRGEGRHPHTLHRRIAASAPCCLQPGQELVDFGAQQLRLARKVPGRAQHLIGGAAGHPVCRPTTDFRRGGSKPALRPIGLLLHCRLAFGWAWGGDCAFAFYLPFSSCTFVSSCLRGEGRHPRPPNPRKKIPGPILMRPGSSRSVVG